MTTSNVDPVALANQEAAKKPMEYSDLLEIVYRGQAMRLMTELSDVNLLPAEKFKMMLQHRNEFHKAPLDLAATFGRSEILKEFVARGVDVNSAMSNGYTALHHAACWGRLDCIKQLYFNGANIQAKTNRDERAIEISRRFQHGECTAFLLWAEARDELHQSIQTIRETVADPEKVQGRFTKEDRKFIEVTCVDKENWLTNNQEASLSGLIAKKLELEETMLPFWEKLNEPVPEKK